MSVKQVIVLRVRYPDGRGGHFKPRLGKLVAQGSHASMKVFFDRIEEIPTWGLPDVKLPPRVTIPLTPDAAEWVFGTFTKIVVGVESEDELLDLVDKAKDAGLPWALIEDCGFTEFKGVPTKTALAIGPASSDLIDPITGHLKLL